MYNDASLSPYPRPVTGLLRHVVGKYTLLSDVGICSLQTPENAISINGEDELDALYSRQEDEQGYL